MIVIRYALIGRDGDGNQLAIVGTHHEPLTKHNKVAPKFHTFCLSFLALNPAVVSVDVISWQTGIDIKQAPTLLTAERTDMAGTLSYSVMEVQG